MMVPYGTDKVIKGMMIVHVAAPAVRADVGLASAAVPAMPTVEHAPLMMRISA